MAEIKDKHDELLLTDGELADIVDKSQKSSIPAIWALMLVHDVAKAQLDKADRYYEKLMAEMLFSEVVD